MDSNDFGKYIIVGILLFIVMVAVILNFFVKPGGKLLIRPKLFKGTAGDKPRHFANLDVTNRSNKKISIFQPFVAFKFGHKTRSFKTVDHNRSEHNLKHINPGESITFHVDLDHYKKTLGDDFFDHSSVVFIIEDSAGLEYKSGKVTLEFEEDIRDGIVNNLS